MKVRFSTSDGQEQVLDIKDITIIDDEIYYFKELIDYGISSPLTLYGDVLTDGVMNIEYDSSDFDVIISCLRDISKFSSSKRKKFIKFCNEEDDDIVTAVNEIKYNRKIN